VRTADNVEPQRNNISILTIPFRSLSYAPRSYTPIKNWAVELGPPNALLRREWKKSSMPFGARITVDGFAAKNGKEFATGNADEFVSLRKHLDR